MKTLLLLLALSAPLCMRAGTFTIHVRAGELGEEVVSLYRYADLFTLRTVFVTSGLFSADGRTTLQGNVEGTEKMQLRMGDRTADLFVRAGSELFVEPVDLGAARSVNGTTRMGLNFEGIDPLDINSLTTDLNDRIDAFLAEDLATDQAAGMNVLEGKRNEGKAATDPLKRPPTLFVTPVLSDARVDSFEWKLRRFYGEIRDPWFDHYLNHSIAGLRFGPRADQKALFNTYLKGGTVCYDDPEFVRLIRTLFSDLLDRMNMDHRDTLALLAAGGSRIPMTGLFQRNDFLRGDDRLAELVMMDQLYLKHAHKLVHMKDAETILMDVLTNSAYPEHRGIASNMLWDITVMRVGSTLPEMRLEDPGGDRVQLRDLLQGPMCIAITADWCTYCATELAGLMKIAAEYPDAVKVIVIGLDKSLEAFNAGMKKEPANEFIWLHALAEQQLRDELRLRSLPAYFLLNDDVLARSPAPLPSQGLAALFHQAHVHADKEQRLRVWDE